MYVYLLECEDGSIYTGITSNLSKRFKQHQSGWGSKYTSKHRVKKILYYETLETRRLARQRELEIKTWDHQSKIDLINGLLKYPRVVREWDASRRKWINLDDIKVVWSEEKYPPVLEKVGRIFYGTNFVPVKPKFFKWIKSN